MRDVGDGDGEHEAAEVGGICVRRGVNRVVVVLGVGRVDGDQRQVAPVLAMGEARRARRLGLFQRGFGEDMRDVDAQSARSG